MNIFKHHLFAFITHHLLVNLFLFSQTKLDLSDHSILKSIANHSVEHSDLDQVWCLMTPLSSFKKKSSLLDNHQRLEMVHRAKRMILN